MNSPIICSITLFYKSKDISGITSRGVTGHQTEGRTVSKQTVVAKCYALKTHRGGGGGGLTIIKKSELKNSRDLVKTNGCLVC